ncbi:MAG: hypothetical protein J6V40_00990, partial [Clostridia bacterium]|nr:hypothetical protein [Clostridia bacterium]
SQSVTSNLTYYQVKDNITINYYNRAGNVETTESYLAGETITSKAIPSGASGWSTSSTSSNIVTPATHIGSTAGTYNFYPWYSFDVVYHYNGTTHTETVGGSNIPTGHSATNVIGWASSQTSTTPVVMSSYRNSTSDVHLYAIYQYTATFTWHGGSSSDVQKSAYTPNSVTFTLPPNPAGYTESGRQYEFDYWNVNGSRVYGSTSTASGNVTIEAVYKDVTPPPPSE